MAPGAELVHIVLLGGAHSMINHLFIASQRMKFFLISLGLVLFMAPDASAALKKYLVRTRALIMYAETSPRVEFISSGSVGGVGLIDESGANPVLEKLIIVARGPGRTTLVPGLTNGFIWFHGFTEQGPPSGVTGTGGTDSSINWGNMSGWTITGGTYCHSVPSYICGLATAVDQETVATAFLSGNYDIGTWTFHGTGFDMPLPYISRTGKTDLGNSTTFLFGPTANDGTVPALPLLGIGAVGVSVFAMGVASIRRRKE